MEHCPVCDYEYEDNTMFCPVCGNSLRKKEVLAPKRIFLAKYHKIGINKGAILTGVIMALAGAILLGWLLGLIFAIFIHAFIAYQMGIVLAAYLSFYVGYKLSMKQQKKESILKKYDFFS